MNDEVNTVFCWNCYLFCCALRYELVGSQRGGTESVRCRQSCAHIVWRGSLLALWEDIKATPLLVSYSPEGIHIISRGLCSKYVCVFVSYCLYFIFRTYLVPLKKLFAHALLLSLCCYLVVLSIHC